MPGYANSRANSRNEISKGRGGRAIVVRRRESFLPRGKRGKASKRSRGFEAFRSRAFRLRSYFLKSAAGASLSAMRPQLQIRCDISIT